MSIYLSRKKKVYKPLKKSLYGLCGCAKKGTLTRPYFVQRVV